MEYPNIYSLFVDRVKRFGALNQKQPRDLFYFRSGDSWRSISWDRFAEEVKCFASALLARGLHKGGSVCVLMGNVPEWPIADLGIIAAGGVGTGLYPTSSAEQCQYVIDHSDAEFVVVDTVSQLRKIQTVHTQLPKLKTIIVLDEEAASTHADAISYRAFINQGRQLLSRVSSLLEARAEAAPEDVAILVYTSGTTGRPKGACLSHRYVLNSVESLGQTIPLKETDISFSHLPFCHVAERISGLYNRLYSGAAAYFVDDLSRLGEYMLDVRPTVFASLPRFFEKIHARILGDLELLPADDRRKFKEALDLGRQLSRLRQRGENVPEKLKIEYEQRATHLERVKDYFGGRIRLATSGGAPLPLEVAEFFDAAGLPILQAYGLTENVCVAFNRPDKYRFGTVGPPMPGCEVKIAADGEILVLSKMMFSGYYKSPEQTAEVLKDGWLLTGDLGHIDSQGFLSITGRKKELIVTSTGKKIAPALIENMLKEHHLISQAMVYGEGKSYLVALITLNAAEAANYAKAHGFRQQSFDEMVRSQEIGTLMREIVDQVNSRVSSTESIKKFLILERDFELERDEITPTGKLRREVITQRFGESIAGLYT